MQIYAFDPSRPSHNRSDGILGMYKSASCRTALDLRLMSPPPNATVGVDQLFTSEHSQQMEERQRARTTAIVIPSVVGVFLAAVIAGCLALGLAKKGSAAAAK